MRTIDLPRKHHFNPRFYLDRWTGRDKQLCEMRPINGKTVPKRPDGVATAGHALFYEERGWSERREANPRYAAWEAAVLPLYDARNLANKTGYFLHF